MNTNNSNFNSNSINLMNNKYNQYYNSYNKSSDNNNSNNNNVNNGYNQEEIYDNYPKRKYYDYRSGNPMMMNSNGQIPYNTQDLRPNKKRRKKKSKHQRMSSATSVEMNCEQGSVDTPYIQGYPYDPTIPPPPSYLINSNFSGVEVEASSRQMTRSEVVTGKATLKDHDDNENNDNKDNNEDENETINKNNINNNINNNNNGFYSLNKKSMSLLEMNENVENKLKLFYHSKIKNQKDKSLLYLAKIFPFDAIEEKLHYHFKNRLYLVEAFTHASYTTVITHNYERLEFLGDATLDWILQRFFFLTYPSASAAELSELRQAAVNNESLARLSIGLGYHYYLMHHSVNLQNEITMYIDMLEKKKTISQNQDNNTKTTNSTTNANNTNNNPNNNQEDSSNQNKSKNKNKKNSTKNNNNSDNKNSNNNSNNKKGTNIVNSSNSNPKLNSFTANVAAQHPLQSTYEGPKVLGDLFEAVIGAVLVDSNYNVTTVWRVFRPLLSDFLDKHASPENLNQSTVRSVHEYCQKLGFAVNDLQYR